MSSRKWMDNAFWEKPETKDDMSCILEIEDDDGKLVRQVMRLKKYIKDTDELNPDFAEVVEVLGEELITKNTEDRIERKKNEKEETKLRDKEYAKARKLEELFSYKMEAFEVDEIKSCKDRKLKARLRRSKSKFEVNLYAMMIIQNSIDNQEKEIDGKE